VVRIQSFHCFFGPICSGETYPLRLRVCSSETHPPCGCACDTHSPCARMRSAVTPHARAHAPAAPPPAPQVPTVRIGSGGSRLDIEVDPVNLVPGDVIFLEAGGQDGPGARGC